MFNKIVESSPSFCLEDREETPVQLIQHPLLKEYGIELYVKRDDMIHPLISGNKWRKLKYIIQDMMAVKKKYLVTFGGAWSNHILATACAGATFGFKTVGFIRGEEVQNPVLTVAKLFGMELIFTDRTQYRTPQTVFEDYLSKVANPNEYYFLEQGGQHPLAIKGCEEIIKNLPFVPNQIYCACGTGTTLAGLALGLSSTQENDKLETKNTRLFGIPVIGQGDLLREDILALNPKACFELLSAYHFGGYAKTKPELLNFISDFCRHTGILIEPIYTGKLFYAIFDQIKQGKITSNQKILAIHTGGLTSFLGMYEKWK